MGVWIRLEYRGYDSAGVALDAADGKDIAIVKKSGKVKALEEEILAREKELDFDGSTDSHVGIAHTRWATHGVPSEVNSHPQRSDVNHAFLVVHNGIVTNYKDVKMFLLKKGYHFESETDTEVIAKLVHHIYMQNPNISFRELIEQVIQQLEGAFALCFKSKHFPGECVATRRGSPLLVGIKAKTRLATDHVPILYSKVIQEMNHVTYLANGTHFSFCSCAKDDDVAAVKEGSLSIHRLRRTLEESHSREIITLKMEIQQIMKGNYSSFMQKEIFEQPESVINTMRGRLNFESQSVILGGIKHLDEQIREVLKLDEKVLELAKDLYQHKSLLIMGRGYNYATCMEGALKVKELTYMHSEGIMAGELKHGPLALVDNNMPVIMIVTRDPVYVKCMNALQQVTAREGRPIIICEKGDDETMSFASRSLEVPHTVDCLQIMGAFRETFNKALPRKATLLDWERCAFGFGSVKDRPQCGRKKTREETCAGVAVSIEQSPIRSTRKRAAELGHPYRHSHAASLLSHRCSQRMQRRLSKKLGQVSYSGITTVKASMK
ncbi:hypothetical protein C0J52_14767 [Blattella germanica]|nr:hypothetical protein C0J52_14767 [Blattella germanica]